jgi:hypothetical protein
MDEAGFWNIIEDAGRKSNGDGDRLAELVQTRLAELPPADIQAFDRIFDAKMRAAYSWPLWGAGWLFRGGCSDDGFEYFRCWVISRGRKVYESAVADPDSLVALADPDKDDEDYECEPLLYAATEAYRLATGTELPAPDPIPLGKPHGEEWDFEDEQAMAERLPRLSAAFT